MIVHRLQIQPTKELSQKLEEFEKQFTYPLGPGRFFRISHGDDYPRFYRAIGKATIFVCESKSGEVLGTLGVAIRPLRQPKGETISALYIGDLKISPTVRGGIALLYLARAAYDWAKTRARVAYGVVMDGTTATPEKYTGRLGILPFQAVGKTIVLRFACSGTSNTGPEEFLTIEKAGLACFERLSVGKFTGLGGTPEERSETEARWLMRPDGSACARIEDTLKAKRLIVNDGVEMKSAHLSFFEFDSVDAGVNLLQHALVIAAKRGFPALFVALDQDRAEKIMSAIKDVEATVAPATIYGCRLPQGFSWNVNTAEI